MKYGYLLASIIACTPLTFAQAEVAAPQSCTAVVKECFAYDDDSGRGDEKTKCFYEKASSPECSGTPLGSLVMHRWGMSASASFASDGADLLTGPAMIDQDCLDKFDSTLSSKLVQGEVPREAISTLREGLDKCAAIASPDDLSRQ